MVAAVLAQLDSADAAGSVDGLMAVELARRVERTPGAQIVGLSRELDRRLAAATGRTLTPDPLASDPVVPDEPDDALTAARRARDDRLRAAAGGAG